MKKLTLRKETLQQLSGAQTDQLAAGLIYTVDTTVRETVFRCRPTYLLACWQSECPTACHCVPTTGTLA